jgi:hypothetical protein
MNYYRPGQFIKFYSYLRPGIFYSKIIKVIDQEILEIEQPTSDFHSNVIYTENRPDTHWIIEILNIDDEVQFKLTYQSDKTKWNYR